MSSKGRLQKKTVQSKVESVKSKDTVTESCASRCLKLLKNGQIDLIDIEGLAADIQKKPSLGDMLQYELHNYCKNNMKRDANIVAVVKLSNLCYSNECIIQFSNMQRFVGCLYYITSYLLKNDKYEEAIMTACSLQTRKAEMLNAIKNDKDLFNFLGIMHSSFMSSAVELLTKSQCTTDSAYRFVHQLGMMSMKFFQFNSMEDLQMAKKIFKKTKIYLHKLQHYNDTDIIQFYGIFKDVMRIMQPKFQNYDFCFYFLFKIEFLQNLDYSNGRDIYQKLERVYNRIKLFCGFSENVNHNIYLLMNLFFISPHDNSASVSEMITQIMNCNDCEKELLFLIISIVFHHGMQHWCQLYENEWNAKASTETLKALFSEVINLTKRFYKSSNIHCSTKSSVLHESCFGDIVTGNLQKIQHIVRQCLKNKVKHCLTLISLSREAFQLSIQCVDTMEKMDCCKLQRSYAWKFAVIHHTNLVEDILRYPPTNETWNHLGECSYELLHQIVKTDFELPYDSKRINILFQRWHQSVLKQQKFSDGFFVCAAFYVSYPTEETDIISMWLRTKMDSESEIFQEMTIMSVIKNSESALKKFNPKFNKNEINKKKVYLMEMKAYSSFTCEAFIDPITPYNLVSRIWKQLLKLNMDIWETSFACTCLVYSNISVEGSNLSKSICDNCTDVVDKLINREYKGTVQCRSFVHAGNLRFYLFLYNVKLAENSGVMESNEMVLDYLKKAEEEKIKFGDDVDLNLTCNVIPSSSHLTIEFESNYITELNEIVEIWQKAFTAGMDEMPTATEYEFWLQNVQLTAYLYELYGEYHRAFATWLVCYKIGKLYGDSKFILRVLTQLMKNCSDVEKSELLKESEDISNQLVSTGQDKEILVAYWLMLGSNYLKNRNSVKCMEQLGKAKKTLETLRLSTRTHTLYAKFWCIVSQFLIMCPNYEVEFGYQEGTDLRAVVFKAFNYVVAGARSSLFKSATQAECTELVLTMLEVNMWAFHFHGIYSQTDFMRFVLDDLYQMVQKLFLPTRTAEVLVRLAEVDLICMKTSDGQEKIRKLKSILTLPLPKTEDRVCNDFNSKCVPVEIHDRTSPRAISPARFLGTPGGTAQTADGSPINMYLDKSKNQEFVQHQVNCKCRICQNFLIQTLVVETINLEAEAFKNENQIKKAAASYNEAIKLLNKLERLGNNLSEKCSLQAKNSLKVQFSSVDFCIRPLKWCSARFLIKFAFFEAYAKNCVSDNLKNAMEKISKLMKRFSYEQKLLMWKFGELKLLWLVFTQGEMKMVQRGTPKEFKTLGITKTPFVGRLQSTTSTKKLRVKETKALTVKKTILDNDDDELKDMKNVAFIGLENLPSEKKKKIFVHPRRLKFETNERGTTAVKKTQKKKLNDIKPKKLNLDQA